MRYHKYLTFIFVFIAISLLLTSCIVYDDEGTNGKESKEIMAEQEPETEDPEEAEKEFYVIGDTAEGKKISITATAMERREGREYNEPTEGSEYVLIDITIENTSEDEYSVSSMLQFNAYVDDVSMSESISAQIDREGSKTIDGAVAGGKKLIGALGYEVPKDWKEIEVHFKPDAFRDTAVKWLIENK